MIINDTINTLINKKNSKIQKRFLEFFQKLSFDFYQIDGTSGN